MKVQRAGSAECGMPGARLLMTGALLAGVGAVAVALFVHELPSLRRELRIYRMAGGLRAGHRYP